MSDYYDRDGNPLTMLEWSRLFESQAHKVVAQDEADGVRVSTVWLGLDHSFGDGPPLIFETMIFGGAHDEDQWRYPTIEEARAGHAEAMKLAGLVPA